ncbi:MAG TPA: TonB-dependent receptor, partial [Candidatus Binataceae bacterium]|nr:TonB-dependent receptor [Candidatus Binataceae bacterium]
MLVWEGIVMTIDLSRSARFVIDAFIVLRVCVLTMLTLRVAHLCAFVLLLGGAFALTANVAFAGSKPANTSVSGSVVDSLGHPIAGATVVLSRPDGHEAARATTDENGLFRVTNLAAGVYSVRVGKTGFKPASSIVVLPRDAAKAQQLVLESEDALTLPISASRLHPQNGLSSSGANKYTMTAKDIGNLPEGESTALNQVMLQMPGVALDQNQEIHIRGEHMGIQYEMNGIMLPLDINTDPTFTQLLNSRIVKSASLIDGVLPAQYGLRTSGVIDIHTRDACDGSPNEVTISGGQRDTAQGSFQFGGCGKEFSYYLTGTFLQSNLGFSSAIPAPDPIHDAVTQGQGFAYLTYAATPTIKLSLMSGTTLSFNQFPNQANLPPQYQYDDVNPAQYPSSAINSGLNLQDYFGVLAINGALGLIADYQLAYSAHYDSQSFYPDPISDLIYQGIASNVFTSDLSNTLQGDLTWRAIASHSIRGGFYLAEYGVESDQTSQVFPIESGQPLTLPISVSANLNKINVVFGFYLQDTWQVTDELALNFGTRWDRVTGFTVDSQFSPTINFVYKPRADTIMHAGFARNFQPPNFQNVSSGIYKLFAGTTGAVDSSPTGNASPYAETDYTWDVGFTYQITPRLAFAQDNYFRIDRHYLDEGQ